MSIFPTKVLLATDGSWEAALAVTTAADLAKSTGSELHVVHVGEIPLVYHPERATLTYTSLTPATTGSS